MGSRAAHGARGTPGLFINGTPILGWGSYASCDAQVRKALAQARAFAERGVPPERVARLATAATPPTGPLLAELLWGAR